MASETRDHQRRPGPEDERADRDEREDESDHAEAAPLLFTPGDDSPLPDGRGATADGSS